MHNHPRVAQLQVTPCLFINKIDRLITELRMTPSEVRTLLFLAPAPAVLSG